MYVATQRPTIAKLTYVNSDLRPFLLPPQYGSYPFKKIDELVQKMEEKEESEPATGNDGKDEGEK